MKTMRLTLIGLLAAVGTMMASVPAMASPNVNISLPSYCYYYDVEQPGLAVDGIDNGVIIEIKDMFNGRDYYGCATPASKFPTYKGWVGYVVNNSAMCGSAASQLLPMHTAFSEEYMRMCPAIYGMVPIWKYRSTGWVKTTVGETAMSPFEYGNRVYVAPYGSHAGWRWVYKNGTWYAVESKWVYLAWLTKL